MEDKWEFYQEVNFEDESINQYHLDTRDFHCSTNSKINKDVNFDKLKKYPERFFNTPKEVKDFLDRIFKDSGDRKKWRMLTLDSTDKRMGGWNMKYIRIHRTELGLVVCDRNHYALNKEILSCNVNQEHLQHD
jgi:hypothetical protein